jgi:hypothetical protein
MQIIDVNSPIFFGVALHGFYNNNAQWLSNLINERVSVDVVEKICHILDTDVPSSAEAKHF